MIRVSAIVAVAVALLAGCGSSHKISQAKAKTGLTPAAYRTQMNSACGKASTVLAPIMSSTGSSTALDDKTKLHNATGVLQTLVTTMRGIKPPSSLASSHSSLVSAVENLHTGVQMLASVKPGKASSTAGFAAFGSIMQATQVMQTSLKTLKLTTCSTVLTGQ